MSLSRQRFTQEFKLSAVEGVVTEDLIEGAVELVGAGLRRHLHEAAAGFDFFSR